MSHRSCEPTSERTTEVARLASPSARPSPTGEAERCRTRSPISSSRRAAATLSSPSSECKRCREVLVRHLSGCKAGRMRYQVLRVATDRDASRGARRSARNVRCHGCDVPIVRMASIERFGPASNAIEEFADAPHRRRRPATAACSVADAAAFAASRVASGNLEVGTSDRESCGLANYRRLPGWIVSQGLCGFVKSPLSRVEPGLGEREQPPIGTADRRMVADAVKDCQGRHRATQTCPDVGCLSV